MKVSRKLERAALAILLLAIVYLACLNRGLRSQLRNFRSETIASSQEAAASQAATDKFVDESRRVTTDEHAEVLRLRGQVAQLSRELPDRSPPGHESGLAPTPSVTNSESDTELFTAAMTNSVPSGSLLVVGGWPSDGKRTYLLLAPVKAADGTPGNQRVFITSYVLRAPDSFWAAMDWSDASSDTRRSTFSGILNNGEADALLAYLKQTKESTISKTQPSEVSPGGHVGVAFTEDEEAEGTGLLMSVEIYPRAIPGTELIELGISPSPPSDKVPVHHSLKRLALDHSSGLD